jgi:opacity protein-like surface antigen
MKRPIGSALVATALLLGAADTVTAQSAGDGYLFHRPVVTLSVRGGYSHANAASDVFQDVTQNLTLDRGDFSSLSVTGDVAVPVTERVELVFSGAYSRAKHKSAFRDLVDNNELPIEQTTTFERVPLTASVRLDLGAAGRSIGRLAWIPSRVVPYVGAGIGGMRYRFRQEGDFVNFATNAVFSSVLDTEAAQKWTLVEQGMAGVDYNFTPQLGLSLDARYLHARGELGSSFKGYDKIDLSGVTATIGLSLRL